MCNLDLEYVDLVYIPLIQPKNMAHRSLWPNTSQSYNTVWHRTFMYCMHANPHCSCSDHHKFMLDIPSMIPVVLEVTGSTNHQTSSDWTTIKPSNHQSILDSGPKQMLQTLTTEISWWLDPLVEPPMFTDSRWGISSQVGTTELLPSFQFDPYLYWWYPHVSCEAWKAPELQLRPLKLILNLPYCT